MSIKKKINKNNFKINICKCFNNLNIDIKKVIKIKKKIMY